jgi:hypothetical protein
MTDGFDVDLRSRLDAATDAVASAADSAALHCASQAFRELVAEAAAGNDEAELIVHEMDREGALSPADCGEFMAALEGALPGRAAGPANL